MDFRKFAGTIYPHPQAHTVFSCTKKWVGPGNEAKDILSSVILDSVGNFDTSPHF